MCRTVVRKLLKKRSLGRERRYEDNIKKDSWKIYYLMMELAQDGEFYW
jgi:hypothetical protein